MAKWAIVTGASRGIGASICRNLAASGFDLALVARTTDLMQQLASEIEASYPTQRARVFAVDLMDWKHVGSHFALMEKEFGSAPRVLVNNAGYGGP